MIILNKFYLPEKNWRHIFCNRVGSGILLESLILELESGLLLESLILEVDSGLLLESLILELDSALLGLGSSGNRAFIFFEGVFLGDLLGGLVSERRSGRCFSVHLKI